MNAPKELFYTDTHEWIRFTDAGRVLVGLTEYAQDALGDIVYVNLPSVGDRFEAKERFGDVESVKIVSDVYTPVAGEVTRVNGELADAPEKINQAPYEAWLVELRTDAGSEGFLSAEEYDKLVAEL